MSHEVRYCRIVKEMNDGYSFLAEYDGGGDKVIVPVDVWEAMVQRPYNERGILVDKVQRHILLYRQIMRRVIRVMEKTIEPFEKDDCRPAWVLDYRELIDSTKKSLEELDNDR